MAYTAPDFTTTAVVNENTKVKEVDEQLNVLMGDVKEYLEENFEDIVGQTAGVTGYTKAQTDALVNVKANDNVVVKLTGNQTIAGVKTFSSSPIVPTPTANTQAVNKAYVDTKAKELQPIQRPTKSSPTSIIVDGTELTIASPVAGTDYYFSKTAITTEPDADTIGGFHYGLVPHAESPTGNKTEADMVLLRGINAHSIWTKWFRPTCDPRGMFFAGGKWYDIYLMDEDYALRGYPKAGVRIAGGAADGSGRRIPKIPLAYGGDGTVTYGKFTWFQAAEVGAAAGKRLLSYEEFVGVAYGVDEGKSSSTNGYETTAGMIEHYPNLLSKFGMEQATGVQYIWGADVGGNRDEGSTTWAWRDGLTDGRGQIYSAHVNHITAVILGGYRTGGANSGSRCSSWYDSVSYSVWALGARFACDHLELA